MTDLASKLLPAVDAYLRLHPEVLPAPFTLDLLAFGEYNLNYLATAGERRVVVRLSTGSQEVAAGADQVQYEGAALRLLEPVGVGPRLFHVDTAPQGLPYGLLVEDYLPGRPLDYDSPTDLIRAAATLARLHAFRSPQIERTLLVIDRPLSAYLAFGRDMLALYLTSPGADPAVQRLLSTVQRRLVAAAPLEEANFPTAERGVVHTDVQANNFVVDEERTEARLVDWEKPMLDDPTYDLCHFLAPTTTRWKAGVTLGEGAVRSFLDAYVVARAAAGVPVAGGREGLDGRRRLRQPFVHWRAITWCAMAWVEYQRPDRPLRNEDTLTRIVEYLRPDFLENLFRPLLTGVWPGD
jgi:Ser/Thr protein kinase RdoA (MazF antagonist)